MTERSDTIAGCLREILDELVSRPSLEQAVVAVESGDGALGWSGAAGAAHPDGTPMRPDIPFFLASIDKLYNATIAMMLGERGRLDLDAPIQAFLPPSVTRGLHRWDGHDHTDRIMVRHFLGHTSGLADWLEDRTQGGRSFLERVLEEGDLELDLEDLTDWVRDELTPHFPPQDLSSGRRRARYSDTNYMLLAGVLEAVTGEPLHETHERLLFRPLELRHTFFAGRSRPLEETATPAVLRMEGRPLRRPLFLQSIGAMYATVADALDFLRALVEGRLFQRPGTLATMQERWNRFGLPLDRAAVRAPGWPIEYGLGLMRFCPPRIFAPLHPVPPVLGHTGSTGCWLFHCPEMDLLLAGSVDEVTAGALPYRIVPRILRLFRAWSRDRGNPTTST